MRPLGWQDGPDMKARPVKMAGCTQYLLRTENKIVALFGGLSRSNCFCKQQLIQTIVQHVALGPRCLHLDVFGQTKA